MLNSVGRHSSDQQRMYNEAFRGEDPLIQGGPTGHPSLVWLRGLLQPDFCCEVENGEGRNPPVGTTHTNPRTKKEAQFRTAAPIPIPPHPEETAIVIHISRVCSFYSVMLYFAEYWCNVFVCCTFIQTMVKRVILH